ncbi:MAG TPA: YihY/virulence factor BrkB family protein [Dokdonella sp.]|uniref:YihY/virulence factor BrkB family protein n=1 Tax=Dokdonella sp. TaxID=2291710 RepID=UPI002C257D15|nr:YihY/virulence factor BrkB family protein [Dokdonella sp.]HUD40669.1 YihY/virulence factor BrkB family protein [Dokdonella sp.]
MSSSVKNTLSSVRSALTDFVAHDPMTLAASVAFYSALSFAPVIVLSLWAAAQIAPGSEAKLIEQLGMLLGSQVRDSAAVVIEHADESRLSIDLAGLIGLGALLVSASTAFAQLQTAINAIWGVEARPTNAVWSWIRRRLLSFGMIAVLGFLLMVTLVLSTAVALILSRESTLWTVANELVTLAVFMVAFAGLYRFVPDARIGLRYALAGGALTALLFEGGKWALGRYLAMTTTADAYGAANSLMLLLIWVYYSSLIVLVGAAATRYLAEGFGHGPRSLDHAETVERWPGRPRRQRSGRRAAGST